MQQSEDHKKNWTKHKKETNTRTNYPLRHDSMLFLNIARHYGQ